MSDETFDKSHFVGWLIVCCIITYMVAYFHGMGHANDRYDHYKLNSTNYKQIVTQCENNSKYNTVADCVNIKTRYYFGQ